MINRQEIFNTVWSGAKGQNFKPSFKKRRSIRLDVKMTAECRYRGEGGVKCHIGHLIPDEKYNPELEYAPLVEIAVRVANLIDPGEEIDKAHPDIMWLSDLQRAHDNNISSPELIEEGLRKFAVEYNLKIPE